MRSGGFGGGSESRLAWFGGRGGVGWESRR